MKKILLLFAVIISIIGCKNDDITNNIIGNGSADNTDNSSTLTISLEHTSRTALGEKSDNIYPVYWSEGDKVVVDGILSDEVEIDTEDKSRAKFTVSTTLNYPLHITYPYCSATSANKAVVNFPAEQSYCEGTFDNSSAPMCGYAENDTSAISLKHLASILQISVKAEKEGVILEKIVITASSAIAGEFAVNCQNTALYATENCENSIVYSLPADFAISTSDECLFYISLPAVDVGSCKVEFIETSGMKMVAFWNPDKPLAKGIVREFKSVIYSPDTEISLNPLEVEEDRFTIFYNKIYGHVRYSDGTPIEGVAMSDGFQVTTTDANGYYELNGVTPETWYIYCSMPADVEVPIDEFGRPAYFKKYPSDTDCYNFTFNRLPGGKESKFALFALADTQPSSVALLERFAIQAAPEIKSYSKSLGLPCYGVVLGDVVGSKPDLMEPMRDELAASKVGMPIFPVMGNHDHIAYSKSQPVFSDERNYGYNIKIQRGFEECYGPVNFSFNRGDAHIVGMRNLQHKDNISPSNYYQAFTARQFEWLKRDLDLVPKDKMVILCVHIPLYNHGTIGDGTYRQEVLNLLDQYAEAHIFSGHTHYMRPYDHVWNKTGHKIYEHCISATRPDNLATNIHRDGTPCGYAVHHIEGNKITDWYYKGCVYGMDSRNHQIRIYRGNAITGDAVSGTNTYGTKGYYQFPYKSDMILANIFTSDPSWDVEVYEDGVYAGKMTYFYNISGSDYDKLQGDGSYENPRRVTDGLECSRDWWAIGILFGRLGGGLGNNYNTCHTMWKYTLKNPNAEHIEVRATDRFGTTYKEDKIQDGLEYGYEMYDAKYNPPLE